MFFVINVSNIVSYSTEVKVNLSYLSLSLKHVQMSKVCLLQNVLFFMAFNILVYM